MPASITYDNYPNLVPKDKKVETLATSTVLIAFNRPRNTDHYRRIAKFVDAFFTKFDNLRKPARHPAWRNVNVMATIRGWQRFPAAQEWIDRHRKMVAAQLRDTSDRTGDARGAEHSGGTGAAVSGIPEMARAQTIAGSTRHATKPSPPGQLRDGGCTGCENCLT